MMSPAYLSRTVFSRAGRVSVRTGGRVRHGAASQHRISVTSYKLPSPVLNCVELCSADTPPHRPPQQPFIYQQICMGREQLIL